MIELDNRTSLEVNLQLLNDITNTISDKEIELIITTSDEMKEINKEQRNIDASTDVLSFPYEEMPMFPLGSIVISSFHVETKSQELGHSQEAELTLLYIHGLLHLSGYDHEVDNGEMREKEKEIIEKFSLPQSLIIRTQG